MTCVFNNSLRLVQAQAFFRHGARTPLHHVRSTTVPEACWSPELVQDIPSMNFPCKIINLNTGEELDSDLMYNVTYPKLYGGLRLGRLLTVGQKEALELGARFKAFYISDKNLVSPDFNEAEVCFRSTMYERTIKTLKAAASVMFPYSFHKNTKDKLIILSLPPSEEFLFPNFSNFGLLNELSEEGLAEFANSPVHISMKKKLRTVLGVDHVFDEFIPPTTKEDSVIYFVRDDYTSRKAAGFPMPPGLEALMPELDILSSQELCGELLGKQCNWNYTLFYVMSQAFRMILSNFGRYKDVPKLQLNSCHDSTIMLLLIALDCFDGKWPPFTADVVFELYVDESITDVSAQTLSNSGGDDELDGSNTSTLPENLWLRVLYLGQPVPLKKLWNLHPTKNVHLPDDFIPVRALEDRWCNLMSASNDYFTST